MAGTGLSFLVRYMGSDNYNTKLMLSTREHLVTTPFGGPCLCIKYFGFVDVSIVLSCHNILIFARALYLEYDATISLFYDHMHKNRLISILFQQICYAPSIRRLD